MDLKFLLIFLCTPVYAFSQCSLSGIVMLNDATGKFPMNQIYVNVIESNVSAITNNQGEFRIDNLKPGKYTLRLIKREDSSLGVIFKNVNVKSNTQLDTILLVLFYAPIQDLTLGGFGRSVSMKEYYKNNGLLVYDTSRYNYYSHGYSCGKLYTPVKDSVNRYYRQGEWRWNDRTVFFEKGVLNGPTQGYYESKECGYSGFYKDDKLEGARASEPEITSNSSSSMELWRKR